MKSTLSALALAVAASLANAPASSAIVVTFTPASSHINVGDNVNVDVSISGLGAEILSAVDINFLFSGGAAGRTLADFTDLVTAFGGAANADLTFDTVTAANLGIQAGSFLDDPALIAAQADSFRLGFFTMHGDADGVTTIAFGADPRFQRLFVGLNAATLDVAVGTACIGVGTGSCDGGPAVPEPTTLGLLGLGLLGVAGLRRRQTA